MHGSIAAPAESVLPGPAPARLRSRSPAVTAARPWGTLCISVASANTGSSESGAAPAQIACLGAGPQHQDMYTKVCRCCSVQAQLPTSINLSRKSALYLTTSPLGFFGVSSAMAARIAVCEVQEQVSACSHLQPVLTGAAGDSAHPAQVADA